jgi:hypothetical protein
LIGASAGGLVAKAFASHRRLEADNPRSTPLNLATRVLAASLVRGSRFVAFLSDPVGLAGEEKRAASSGESLQVVSCKANGTRWIEGVLRGIPRVSRCVNRCRTAGFELAGGRAGGDSNEFL